MDNEIKILNRFTTLPVLLDYLERQKLVLLDPDKWDDKNDTRVISTYKDRANIKTLLALCFTHSAETIHHWKAFANGSSGCCIEFKAKKLIEIFEQTPNLRHGKVVYKVIRDVVPAFPLADMPFFKRKPYQYEHEYRVIWERDVEIDGFELDVPLETISRITFSQQMPVPIFNSIKTLLRKLYKIKVSQSTVYENEGWINRFH